MESSMRKKIDDLLVLSPDDWIKSFSSILEEIRLCGTSKAMDEFPGMFAQIIRRLVEADSARIANQAPQAMDRLLNLLWEGIAETAAADQPFASALKGTRDLAVNLEAADSPLRSHFKISSGNLSGGSGMIHFKDQDLRYLGPTQDLLKALVGDGAWGKLTREGHSGLMPMLGPILKGISNIIRGNAHDA